MLRLRMERKSRLTKVSLVVIRINKRGELKYSRPCINCLKRLQYLRNYGYNLSNVYYSNEDGEMVNEKFSDLINSEDQYVTRGNR